MSNVTVQEALNEAIEMITILCNGSLDPTGGAYKVVNKCKALLSEIEKCEPVAEAIRERDRLGFAVVNVIGKLDEIIDTTQEVEIDDFLHIAISIDMWNELEAALEDMPKRAELYTSPQPIEKCEPVGELILDPVFLPALKAPLVNWKINLVDLEVGTKFYTSPQPRELYAGDCVAYLYKDNNGGLKICNESPPPDKSFPVFITNLSFLDVARTVLEDCSDLIIKQGSVNLWKELSAKINRDYKQLNTKG